MSNYQAVCLTFAPDHATRRREIASAALKWRVAGERGISHMKTAKKTLDACNALAHMFHKDIDRIVDFVLLLIEAIPAHYGPKSLRPPEDYTKQDAADLEKIIDVLSGLLKSEADGGPKENTFTVTDQSLRSFRSIIKALDRAEMPSMANEMALVYMQSTLEAFLKAYIDEAPIPPENRFSGTSFGSLIRYLRENFAIDLEKSFSRWPALTEAIAYRNAYVHNHGKPDDRFIRQVKSYDLREKRLSCSSDFLKEAAECAHALIDFIQFNLGKSYLLQIAHTPQKTTLPVYDSWAWKGMESADEALGKTMVVQVTFYNSTGQEVDHFMTYGEITAVAADGTLTLTRPNGKPWAVPFDPKTIKLAPPGIYEDSLLGSTIFNADLLTAWQAHSPDDNPEKLAECKQHGFPGVRSIEKNSKTNTGDAI